MRIAGLGRRRLAAVHLRRRRPGFDDASVAGGAGFTNMRDRVAAVGGVLRIASEPGAGTEVSGEIPLPD